MKKLFLLGVCLLNLNFGYGQFTIGGYPAFAPIGPVTGDSGPMSYSESGPGTETYYYFLHANWRYVKLNSNGDIIAAGTWSYNGLNSGRAELMLDTQKRGLVFDPKGLSSGQ